MGESVATIRISRPLDEVWAVLTDPEKSPIWSTPTVEEHWLTPPPVGVGSRRRAVNRGFGRTQTNDAEVTAYEPRSKLDDDQRLGPAVRRDGGLRARSTGATRVDFTWSFASRGGQRLFEPIVLRVFM